ncbi:MAG: hypothetical protein JST05_06025 [Acidobacteria bacterium]|nr:hypothetical protein [Acidobacteriota bacterium]
MRSLVRNFGRIMATIALSTGALVAQDGASAKGFDAQFKLRAGAGLQTDDNLSRKVLGFGLDFGYGFDFGRIGLEVGYQYKPGDQYLTPLSTPAAGAAAPVSNDVAGSFGFGCLDSRKNTLDGLTARLSFQRDFSANWGWQGGIQLGGSRFRQEYIGNATDLNTYFDSWQGTPTKSTLGVSPYLGVIYHVNKDSHLELNLIDIGYKSINFVHHPGSAVVAGDPNTPGSHVVYAGDHLEEASRHQLHLEIGYAFHF